MDYAVKMRQLPPHTALDEILERGELTESETRLIAAKIAEVFVSDGRAPSRQRDGWEPVSELPYASYVAPDTNGPL